MPAPAVNVARPLPVRTPAASWWNGFLGWLTIVFEVTAEAREMERDAHRRYPFVSW